MDITRLKSNLLRLILPMLVLMSFLYIKPLTIEAFSWGVGEAEAPGDIELGGAGSGDDGAGFASGFSGIVVYRMKAIPCSSDEPAGIAAETGAFIDGGSTLVMKEPFGAICSASSYNDDNWLYFSDSWAKDRAIVTTIGGVPKIVTCHTMREYSNGNGLIQAFFRAYGSNFDKLDLNLRKVLNSKDTIYSNIALLNSALNISSSNFIIIVEAIPVYKNEAGLATTYSPVGDETKVIFGGCSVNEYQQNSGFWTFNPSMMNALNSRLMKEGNDLPFGYLNISNRDTCGYALYGKVYNVTFGNPIALNLHVQYQGEPLTSGPCKTATSFITRTGAGNEAETGGYADIHDTYGNGFMYYNFSRQTWTRSGDWDEIAQHGAFGLYSTPPYKMIFADNYIATPARNILFSEISSSMRSQSYTMSWTMEAVSGGSHNIGFKILPATLQGVYGSTIAVAVRLAGIIEATPTIMNSIEGVDSMDFLEVIKKNVIEAWENSGRSAITTNEGNGVRDVMLNRDVPVGVAIEFSAKGVPVHSRKVTVVVNENSDGSITVDTIMPPDNWYADYSSLEQVFCTTDAESAGWVVVENDKVEGSTTCRYDSAVIAAVSRVKSDSAARSALYGAVGGDAKAKGDGIATLALGSTGTAPVVGYTVYEVIYRGPINSTGQCELPAWMLNRYYPYVINSTYMMERNLREQYPTREGMMITVRKDWTHFNGGLENWWGEKPCPRHNTGCEHSCGYIIKYINGKSNTSEETKDYRITWYDISGGGWHVGKDNGAAGTYFPKMSNVWTSASRGSLIGGVTEDTRTWTDDHEYKPEWNIDYGFNLCRSSVGDIKTFSGVTHPSNPDGADVLKNQFGVKPLTVKSATPVRNSGAIIGKVSETLRFQSRYTYFGSTVGQYWSKDYRHTHGDVWKPKIVPGKPIPPTPENPNPNPANEPDIYIAHGTLLHSAVNESYWWYRDRTCRGFKRNGAVAGADVSHSWSNIVFKYTTQPMPKGWNTVCGASVNGHAPLMNWTYALSEGAVQDSNEYRAATVRNNSVTLQFYPDVLMAAKFAGGALGETTLAASDGSGYNAYAVMGESLRKTNSSGIYLYKINGTGEGAITGATYSDSMLGGSAILDDSKVVVPAGSDVNVVVDTMGITIDCYGYILDMVDQGLDGSVYAEGGNSYTNVVRSGMNVYREWMGSSQFTILQNHFKDWCNAILDIENYAADLHLEVDGHPDDMHNFSATIGNVDKVGVEYSDMSYQLIVERGALNTGGDGYKALIAQIALDYACSEAEASALFESSGMWQAIRESIEYCGCSVNNSGGTGTCGGTNNPDIADQHRGTGTAWHNCNSSFEGMLGGSGDWYDEKVYTFVVRRFVSEGNQFKNIMATDKIDYSLAPTGSLTNYQDINSANSNDARWYLTLFFDKNKEAVVNDKLIGSGTYFDPHNDTNCSSANNGYTVLINKAKVMNADFSIPAQSTDTFGR